ncbi:hypothetical protein V6N11_021759 [Hibiscus sabdariffa]|uniref:Uncharacterized protein n=1 Tax=Hibiscus sabdariffa TaxID=183260 RepID=A0ABR2TI55_9ROSI
MRKVRSLRGRGGPFPYPWFSLVVDWMAENRIGNSTFFMQLFYAFAAVLWYLGWNVSLSRQLLQKVVMVDVQHPG